jgi:hypothetical protein
VERIKQLISVDFGLSLIGASNALEFEKAVMLELAKKIEFPLFVARVAAEHDSVIGDRCLNNSAGRTVEPAGFTVEIGQSPNLHLSLNIDKEFDAPTPDESSHLG